MVHVGVGVGVKAEGVYIVICFHLRKVGLADLSNSPKLVREEKIAAYAIASVQKKIVALPKFCISHKYADKMPSHV